MAAAVRIPLLWDDPWAPGLDGGYYVLQVRSWQAGEPLFADRSLVFPVLAVLGRLCGDVVVGNKVAACAFAAASSAAVAVAAGRWTRSVPAALVAGVWLAVSPSLLGVSHEFLKNAGGVAVLCAVLAVLAGEQRWTRPRIALLLGLLGLGLGVHKVTGVLALGTTLVWAVVSGAGARVRSVHWFGLGAALLVLVAMVGVLRPVDLTRLTGGHAEGAARLGSLLSGRLPWAQVVEVGLTHTAPGLLLALVAWRARPEGRALGLALAALALVCTAPGLPFGWDLTSWRLLLLGGIPVSLAAGLGVSLAPRGALVAAAGALTLGLLATTPSSVRSQAAREPDYVAWAAQIPTIQATVPPGERIVAHRGLCGFVWYAANRVCENFQPAPPHEGWWRISYGFGPQHLEGAEHAPTPLLPGYQIVRESDWQVFRSAHLGEFSLLTSERNPYQPRPGFVYGPGGETPQP